MSRDAVTLALAERARIEPDPGVGQESVRHPKFLRCRMLASSMHDFEKEPAAQKTTPRRAQWRAESKSDHATSTQSFRALRHS
jgi:hypothetical protein